MKRSWKHFCSIVLTLGLVVTSGGAWPTDEQLPTTTGTVANWDGPTAGPLKQRGKKVTFIMQDARNGGISSAYRGFYLAAIELGWTLNVVDARNSIAAVRTLMSQAITQQQDAIIFGGIEFDDNYRDLSALARQKNIILAGWHAAAKPGPSGNLFTNITTPFEDVGKLAAEFVINNSRGDVGVIILNDERFAIANAKTAVMANVLRHCARCSVLAIENIQIDTANDAMPGAVLRWNRLYGKRWTHTLAINDAYFDAINVPLMRAGRKDVENISAGDGSYTALSRIKSGLSQQVATVAEPFGLQGWQLADELNRAFSGWPPSGYISKPIVITSPLMRQLRGGDIDSTLNYKENYSAIWSGQKMPK
ncbi:MAG: substrate-binding domain-containing protein [Burkholderiales bacterium]|nr:substrate-binding domain-containing protein [Burkholderiales bacterium]